MGTTHDRLSRRIRELFGDRDPAEFARRLEPRQDDPPPHPPRSRTIDAETTNARWDALGLPAGAREELLGADPVERLAVYERNIENFLGTARLPIGVAGPLCVNGLFAEGYYYVPLATTEAALVASYSRGSQIITASGGCRAIVLNEGVSRAPGFAFRDLAEAGQFVVWATGRFEELKQVAEATTKHGKLVDLDITIDANKVYMRFEMNPGDASGQNMVTFATEAVRQHIVRESPVKPQYSFVEANMSGDKKATAQALQSVRGRKVCADVTVSARLVEERLHTTPERIADYWRMSVVGGIFSGAIGHQGHYANGLAALYIATGQDAACVAETAAGVTRFETTPEGDLYCSVTLPNVMIGTVGGGTGLPTQQACLEILGLAGPGKARAFAELCGGLALAGELSIIASLCSGDFVHAHRSLARG